MRDIVGVPPQKQDSEAHLVFASHFPYNGWWRYPVAHSTTHDSVKWHMKLMYEWGKNLLKLLKVMK